VLNVYNVKDGIDNVDLWESVDEAKNQFGFKLTHTIYDGEGSKSNPGRVYFIMEK
jgi:hypothetical protein